MPIQSDSGLLPFAHIAEILGIPETTVRRRYLSALKKMRDALIAEGITEEEFEEYLRIRTSSE
jgi:DNA-directed RNA polymerase specialized sigma24 family protein